MFAPTFGGVGVDSLLGEITAGVGSDEDSIQQLKRLQRR